MATARWLSFFKIAGIPAGPSSEYAVIFSDNRMRMDMLNEITKEILLDLGIKAMGDVIAILRHSKKVYAEISRSAAEEFDLETKSTEQRKKTSGRLYSDLIAKPSTPPVEKLETALPEKKKLQPLKSPPKQKAVIKKDQPKTTNTSKSSNKSLSERFTEYNPIPTKKKKVDEVITISIPSVSEKKSKKMEPLEKTPSQKEMLQSTAAKKTVFDRLGLEPEDKKELPEMKVVPVIHLEKTTRTAVAGPSSSNKDAKSTGSVFNRLGGSSSTGTGSSGLSGRFGKISTGHASSDAKISSGSTFTVTLDGSSSMNINKQGNQNVRRPIKSVKPIPRKPLAMDSEPNAKSGAGKQVVLKSDNIGKSKTIGKSDHEKKNSSKSVFDRLGK